MTGRKRGGIEERLDAGRRRIAFSRPAYDVLSPLQCRIDDDRRIHGMLPAVGLWILVHSYLNYATIGVYPCYRSAAVRINGYALALLSGASALEQPSYRNQPGRHEGTGA